MAATERGAATAGGAAKAPATRPTVFRRLRQYSVVPVLLLFPACAAAATGSAADAGVSAMQVVRVFGGLILVLAVLLGGLWLLKRFGGSGLRAPRGQLRVLSSLSVGNRARLLLVQVREAQLLIGVSAQRVELVARFDDAGDEALPASSEGSFVERLRQSLNRERDGGHADSDHLADVDRGGSAPRD